MLGLGSAFEKLSQNMPWNFPWSDTIRKRAIKYLLQRYVGQFLLEPLSLDQLSVDLSNGTGIIKDLSLDMESLNEVAEQLNLPFKFIDGYIGEILVNIPWRNLYNENCFVGISGLKLVLHPKQRDGEISLVDSMIDSMSTSMQIAQECLSQVTQVDDTLEPPISETEPSATIDGIEIFAKIIDTILNKIKVRFTNSVLRLEYVPKSSSSGVALEVKINNIDYFDEAGFEKEQLNLDTEKGHLEAASFTSKKFLIEGVSLFTNEFIVEESSDREIEVNDESEDSFQTVSNKSMDSHSGDDCNSNNSEDIQNNLESSSKTSILIAKLCNRQDIKLKLRKNDAVSGPKVHFEANCGSLISYMTPRQVHLLCELAEGITSPKNIDCSTEILDKSNINNPKPMNQSDFRKIEHELMKNVNPPQHVQTHSLDPMGGGWSSPPEINDDEFLPVYSEKTENFAANMSSSTLTDMSDLEGSYSSTISQVYGNKRCNGTDILTNFKIRINSLCIVLLHEDILISSTDQNGTVTHSSIHEMQKKSQEFFSFLGGNNLNCDKFSDFKKKIEGACNLSHLRFIGTSLIIEGTETTSINRWEIRTNIIAGWYEILECINDSITEIPKMIYNKLLTFKEKPMSLNNPFYAPMKPKVHIAINQSQNMQITGRSRRMSTPRSDIKINMDECLIEVDMSLVDRINTLLNKQEIFLRQQEHVPTDQLPPSHLDNQAFFKDIMDDSPKPESKIKVTLKSPHIFLKIYFPIPDLRPFSDMDRVPWWKRNVRDEVLITEAEDFYLEGYFSPSCASTYEILSNDIHVLFQEKDDLPPVSLLRASGSKGIEKGFNPVRIFIQNFPSKIHSDLEDDQIMECENIMTKSMMGFLEEEINASADIFNKRKVASQQQDNINELTIPADSDKINKFISDTLENVQFDVDISLSDIQFVLPSKRIYELVYNRLVSDLLLWTPSAPTISSKTINSLSSAIEDLSIGTTLIQNHYYSSGTEFKTFTPMDSINEPKDNINNYTSIYDQEYMGIHKRGVSQRVNGQTLIGIQVKMLNGTGTIHTPYRDTENKIVPTKYGDVSVTFHKASIFIASGYKGNRDCCHGSVGINKLNVYHKAQNVCSSTPIHLNSEFPLSPRKLDWVLYPCDKLSRMGGGNTPFDEAKDCVSICFKMDYDVIKNENVFQLAGGMFGLTLEHFMTTSSESWFSQLGDMFNVEDYPIEGYSLPDVITELNFHLEYCSIDYRPLHLPLKCYVAIDSLAISSNLTAKANSSVLLIIVEDAGIFLSQNLACKKVNLKSNYVCVADLGVFELCMKLQTDGSDIPIQEFLFSNNIIHLRTCSDSFKSLMELVIYLANEGDLIEAAEDSKFTKDSRVVLEHSHTDQVTHSPYNKQTSLNCHEIVENLMQEAMIESKSLEKSSSPNKGELEEDIFFFPDENKRNKRLSRTSNNELNLLEQSTENALKEALEDEYLENAYVSKPETDDEFCFLEEVPGTGIKSPSGKPKAKHIKAEHILIKDDHFDPSNNFSHEASTPKHFPKPDTKYNLQELSIIWHLFGGNDFGEKEDLVGDKNGNHKVVKVNKKTKSPSPYNSPKINTKVSRTPIVSFSNDPTILEKSSISFSETSSAVLKPNANAKWFAIGGPNRHHDTMMEIQLTKIRFKYDIYPNECTLDSRHVLAINDIEIRDRLASSDINKFLYQYSSELCPKQASSNMINVKAITKRNEPSVNTSETNLNISVKPIRLHIDQDALIFLSQFAENIISSDKEVSYGEEEKPYSSFTHAPVLTVPANCSLSQLEEKTLLNEPLNQKDSVGPLDKDTPIYFRNVVFSPDVPIRIDYHGKHVDINSQYGALAGLIIGLGQLNHSEITLKRVEFKSGVLGVNKLMNSLTKEWIFDIRKNQLPSILGGVGPMHSFVKLFNGFKDLLWLPVEQYNKDGRVLRGLQKGTNAFTSSSAYAVLDLTGRFIGCIQSTAETMYDMVSSGPSVRSKSYKTKRGQPKDIREGVTAAFGLVRNGLGDTATTLMKVASEEHSHKGVSGAVGGVLRQIPPSFVQPIIIASEATCTVLGGMTNQLVPNARKEAADKWKS